MCYYVVIFAVSTRLFADVRFVATDDCGIVSATVLAINESGGVLEDALNTQSVASWMFRGCLMADVSGV